VIASYLKNDRLRVRTRVPEYFRQKLRSWQGETVAEG